MNPTDIFTAPAINARTDAAIAAEPTGGRSLTVPELMGWRYFWDGFVICPACQEGILARPRNAQRTEWPVPADYDRVGISAARECSRCRNLAAQDTNVIRHHLTYATPEQRAKAWEGE